MIRRQAFKFELMPAGKQQCAMRCFAGARRFVFNRALALQNERHASGGGYIGYVAMAKLLTAWRHDEETPWLKEAPVHPLQHALKDLDRAFQNFFAKRAGHPRFCKRGQRDSFRYPDPKQIKLDQGNARLFLAQARLVTLSQEPRRVGGGEAGDRVCRRLQVVCGNPDRA